MSTDQELLERAAKAAGIDLHVEWMWTDEGPARRYRIGRGGDTWNPLTDDGDALRLAVALGLCVGRSVHGDRWCAQHNSLEDIVYEKGDPCAATRRAIVRAAAALA